jgi:hypothetical protein
VEGTLCPIVASSPDAAVRGILATRLEKEIQNEEKQVEKLQQKYSIATNY